MSIDMDRFKIVFNLMEPGETRRVDHDGCMAGTDTRQRLYLTRVQAKPDLVVGYCHNCSESGSYTTAMYESFKKDKHASAPYCSTISDDEIMEPSGIVFDFKSWPTDAKSWAYKNSLSTGELELFNIGYDPTSDRIYLPRYGEYHPLCTNSFNGYQLRKLQGHGPKYVTIIKLGKPSFSMLNPLKGNTKVVVVEDLASGIAIYNSNCDVDAMVIYGTKIDPEAVYACTLAYTEAAIWLDNDSDYIIAQANKFARTIQLYGTKASVVPPNFNDPKHYNKHSIKDILGGVWTA